MNTKAVIFDMDGVLVDSWEPHYRSWVATGEKLGLTISREAFGNHFGQVFNSFATQLSEEQNVELSAEDMQKWYTDKEAAYRGFLREDFPEHNGASELVRNLNDSGFKTAIGSSAQRKNIEQLIELLPDGELLRTFVSAEDVDEGKPNPQVFLLAAERLGVPAGKCAVIEDSLHGLEAAKRAGMTAIGITGTVTREAMQEWADLIVDELTELSPEKISDLIG